MLIIFEKNVLQLRFRKDNVLDSNSGQTLQKRPNLALKAVDGAIRQKSFQRNAADMADVALGSVKNNFPV